MKIAVPALFVLLLILHQDFWLWQEDGLLFGFMPIGLAYHALYSMACAGLGWLAIRHLWPHAAEKHASGSDDE